MTDRSPGKTHSKAPLPPRDDAPVRDLVDQISIGIDVLVLFFLSLYAVVRPLVPPPDAAGMGIHVLLQVLIATALLMWVLRTNLQGGFAGVACGAEWALGAWILLGAVSAVMSVEPFRSYLQLANWAGDLAAFWLAMQYARTAAGARLLLRIALATGLVAALYGLYQYGWGFQQMRDSPETAQWLRRLTPAERIDAEARLGSNRIFSTFVLPNSLAGYLGLLIPVALATAMGRMDGVKPRRRRTARAAAIVVAHALLLAFALTGSKGAALALGASLACGLAIHGGPLARRYPGAVAKAALTLALGAIVFAGTAWRVGPLAHVRDALGDVFPTTAILGKTARFRLGYWDAAVRIAADHPVLGVGPDQFRSHYHAYRAPTASEVRHTHNDYLQLACELGIPGVALYLAGIVLVARCLWRPPPAPEGDPAVSEAVVEPTTRRVLDFAPAFAFAGGVCGFGLLYAMDPSFDAPTPAPGDPGNYEAAFHLVAGFVWLVAAMFLRPEPGPGLAWGLGAGLLAHALHGAVDFDLYVPQVSAQAALLAGVACGLAARRAARPLFRVRLPLPGQLVCGLSLLVPFFLLTHGWLPRAVKFDNALAQAQQAIDKLTEGAALARLEEALDPETGIPWHVPTLQRLADIEQRNFLRQSDYQVYIREHQYFKVPRLRFERAAELNDRLSINHFEIGRWWAHFAALCEGQARSFPVGSSEHTELTKQAGRGWEDAIAAYRRAIDRYPTLPTYRYHLGLLLFDHGDTVAGRAELEHARALSDQREPGDALRLVTKQLEEIANRLAPR